ncbi:MAG: AmmeMemoRadiSam system protein B [Deltaproteobacteria bacterium]|nr:AmmeMemoRadiSam system protein B [Deltaproteobacteria bacterium]
MRPSPQDDPVRLPAVAGSWYSADPTVLGPEIDRYLAGPAPDCAERPLALVVPHAGYRYSGAVAGEAFRQVRGCTVRRVWVLAPAHRVRLDGAGLYPVRAFRTPLGDLPLDLRAQEALIASGEFKLLSRGDGGEHSLEIELPLLQRALGAFELVPILVGNLDPARARRVADVLRPLLGPDDLVVVSTDFTHYGERFGYTPFPADAALPQALDALDHQVWEQVVARDPEGLHEVVTRTGATVCGRNALKVLAALLPAGARVSRLRYTTSGAMTGDWANSVSYLAGAARGTGWSGLGPSSGGARFVSPETGAWLLDLAHRSQAWWYAHQTELPVAPAEVPEEARRVLGAFVTLTDRGALRGCIGEIEPRRPVWEAVRARAVDAAVHDARFQPVRAEEIEGLDLDITLLGPSWTVAGPEAVILGRHGIVVREGRRRATFLPQVAPEQGWDRATTLSRLRRKAGIAPRSQVEIDVYEAQVILPAGH